VEEEEDSVDGAGIDRLMNWQQVLSDELENKLISGTSNMLKKDHVNLLHICFINASLNFNFRFRPRF
jgi:hypothetical protein